MRAAQSFSGGNNGGPEFLCFDENDTVEVLSTTGSGVDGWWKGRVVDGRFAGRSGLFPSDYVHKQRVRVLFLRLRLRLLPLFLVGSEFGPA